MARRAYRGISTRAVRRSIKAHVSIQRIGIMTGGGDCPGLNAVIRAVVLKAHGLGWEVMGIEDATEGLIDLEYKSPRGNRLLTPDDVDGILTRGGTILGTSNRSDPFRYVADGEETDVSERVGGGLDRGIEAEGVVGRTQVLIDRLGDSHDRQP